MEAVLERPTREEQDIAIANLPKLDKLARFIHKGDKIVNVSVSNHDMVSVALPAKVFRVLQTILELMAEGKAFQVIPSEIEISTKQAADMLNVSRPFLVKLLEEGKIPYKKVKTHRRIYMQDLLIFIKLFEAQREKALQDLADESQKLGLGY